MSCDSPLRGCPRKFQNSRLLLMEINDTLFGLVFLASFGILLFLSRTIVTKWMLEHSIIGQKPTVKLVEWILIALSLFFMLGTVKVLLVDVLSRTVPGSSCLIQGRVV